MGSVSICHLNLRVPRVLYGQQGLADELKGKLSGEKLFFQRSFH